MTTGGMVLEESSPEQRKAAGASDGEMALYVKHVGQYGEHAVAKNAGVRVGDIVVAFDGRKDLLREADVFRQGLWERKPGQRVPITVSREGKRIELKLLMQK